ncbi:hypothetical protein Ahy_A01g003411 isoform B [Arachis hypogaea]|uniref:Uncharacterized protein n=1 Tax=Arachis hypogaea TaxID=3818 RepID=A0A445ESV2_ARAHY|nr:hypothetical protein Ahy_A01g003411 isoform B [Arachis hypogaea]
MEHALMRGNDEESRRGGGVVVAAAQQFAAVGCSPNWKMRSRCCSRRDRVTSCKGGKKWGNREEKGRRIGRCWSPVVVSGGRRWLGGLVGRKGGEEEDGMTRRASNVLLSACKGKGKERSKIESELRSPKS